MPPQKNSGAKASKRVSGVQAKNSRFVSEFMSDLTESGNSEDIYIARVISRMGNGRMEVFYMDSQQLPQTVQAVIRGSFRGKGKRSVWIDIGSIVVIADSGISGSAEFEIMAILTPTDVHEIKKIIDLDPRILAVDNTDGDALKAGKGGEEQPGFEFDIDEEIIDNI